MLGFPGSSAGKESTYNARDLSSIPGLGSSPGEGIGYPLQYSWASLVAQTIKNLPAMRRLGFNPWVGKIPWRRARQPTPVFLPGESLWTEEPGGLQSMGSQRAGHDWETKLNTYCFCDIHYSILWWVMALNSWKHVRSWKQDWSDFSGGHTVCHIVSTQCRFVGIE